MKKAMVSLVSTVYNEEATAVQFIESILSQSELPDEIIIVDGGSNDNTLTLLKKYKDKIRVYIKRGNRSIGRNYAISRAAGSIILLSDAGCVLDREWTRNLTNCFINSGTKVVAGYCKAKAQTIFQKCLVPYVLVMPDRVNSFSFLPSTRSMGIRKSVWKEHGGFPERFSHNEDYVFAKTLQRRKVPITFCKNAIVYWIPRKNVKDAFIMFFRFAFGDAEAKIIRPKVIFVFLRYLIASLLFLLAIMTSSGSLWIILLILSFSYLIWSVLKNFRHVRKVEALFILPVMQLIADFAVLLGTVIGLFSLLKSN